MRKSIFVAPALAALCFLPARADISFVRVVNQTADCLRVRVDYRVDPHGPLAPGVWRTIHAASAATLSASDPQEGGASFGVRVNVQNTSLPNCRGRQLGIAQASYEFRGAYDERPVARITNKGNIFVVKF
jgi:hypothetical protein